MMTLVVSNNKNTCYARTASEKVIL